MKNLIIIGAMPNMSPYIYSYIKIFKKNNISYDVICWNRNSDCREELPDNYILYNKPSDIKKPFWKKLFDLYGYASFIREKCNNSNYNLVIVFTIAAGVFLQSFLKKEYKGRYIFDIRDYSPIMNNLFFQIKTEKMIEHSVFTVVSSKGFLRWLPQKEKYHYVVTHNIDGNSILMYNEDRVSKSPSYPIRVLTIGQLRDFSSNSCVIKQLCNNRNYTLLFSGTGLAEKQLKEFAEYSHAKNVFFTGYYKKEEEKDLVKKCDMLNILFNHDINSDTLMSNRFYLSVLHRKPMIVRSGTYQAELVSLYNLGVVVGDEDNMVHIIEDYWQTFDLNAYNNGCRSFLSTVSNEIIIFEDEIQRVLCNN